MKRGDVYWVDFDPSIGGEVTKRRPAIIVSNDAAIKHLNRVQVVPITSNIEKLYPSEAFVTLRGARRKAMADQIATVSKKRFSGRLGAISRSEMLQVEHAILIQLGLRSFEGA